MDVPDKVSFSDTGVLCTKIGYNQCLLLHVSTLNAVLNVPAAVMRRLRYEYCIVCSKAVLPRESQ